MIDYPFFLPLPLFPPLLPGPTAKPTAKTTRPLQPSAWTGHYEMNPPLAQSLLDSTEQKLFTQRGPPTSPPGQYIMK